MHDTNNQPVANGLPTSASPVDQSPSRSAMTERLPTAATASAVLPQRDLQPTGPMRVPAPATSNQALAPVSDAPTVVASPTQPGAGQGPGSVTHAAPTSPNLAPSRPPIAPLDSVVPRAPEIAPTLNLSSAPPPRTPIPAPPQLEEVASTAPPGSSPDAVTVPTSAIPSGKVTQDPPVYSDEDLNRIAADTIAGRPSVPGLKDVRALRDLIDRMSQRGLTLVEVHRFLVSQHGFKESYKRFLALRTKVRKKPR